MERVNDLLNPDKQNLAVKESREAGVFVQDLTKEVSFNFLSFVISAQVTRERKRAGGNDWMIFRCSIHLLIVFCWWCMFQAISCLEDVFEIIDRGDKVRKVAATKMNAGSSRSHSVLSIYLEQTNPEGVKITSQLNLVDLAGSERADKTGASGEVLKQVCS